MFLNLKTNVRPFNERGSALMAVLGVMAVTMVIGLTITAATVNGLKVTSTNKALVQSRAAAEAGLAVVVAGLSKGSCLTTVPSTNPTSNSVVEFQDNLGIRVDSCDIASQVKITSIGTAQSFGVGGAESGDKSTVEAVYPYSRTPSGAAIYLATGANFNNGGAITSSATVPAIQVKTGNLNCDNNTVITGSVVVVAGSISLKSCTVTRNAWAFGTTTFPPPGGTIGGILTSAGSRPASHPIARWDPTLPMPSVPVWTEFPYNSNDWKTPALVPFYENIRPTTSGNCPLPNNNGALPTIFNALACAGVSSPPNGGPGSNVITLYDDLVIVAKKFNFTNSLEFVSSDPAVAHRVWFITPDLVPTDHVATCSPGQGAFTIGNNLTITAPIKAMLYTPCAISTGNGFTWRGQMYAGTISNWNNANFGYIGVGLPGANLDAGTYASGGGSPGARTVLGALVSSRDLVG